MKKKFLILPFCFLLFPSSAISAISFKNKEEKSFALTYNVQVQKWLDYFQTRKRKDFQHFLSRSHRYLPTIKRVFQQFRLPVELSYLAMIESGFSYKAVSSAQAVGYWQFISTTGRQYGLKKTWWLDERRDFYQSTVAAARHLKDLYKEFQSWELAAAAYNMGSSRLKGLIRKYKSKDYWVLSQKKGFPRETRNYIPQLMSVILISQAPHLYSFKNIKKLKPYEYDVVYAKPGTRLSTLAKKFTVPLKDLKQLNPALIKGYIPKKVKTSYWVRIPKEKIITVKNH